MSQEINTPESAPVSAEALNAADTLYKVLFNRFGERMLDDERSKARLELEIQRALDAHASRVTAERDAMHEREMDQLIGERDDAEEGFSHAYYLVTGNSPEWSNHFGKDEAHEDIADAMSVLKQSLRNAEASRAELEKAKGELAWAIALSENGEPGIYEICQSLRADLAAVQADLADAKKQIVMDSSAITRMQEAGIRLEAERDALLKDKARLDWLENNRPILWALSQTGRNYWIVTDQPGYTEAGCKEYKTVREAIDAAMSPAPDSGEGKK